MAGTCLTIPTIFHGWKWEPPIYWTCQVLHHTPLIHQIKKFKCSTSNWIKNWNSKSLSYLTTHMENKQVLVHGKYAVRAIKKWNFLFSWKRAGVTQKHQSTSCCHLHSKYVFSSVVDHNWWSEINWKFIKNWFFDGFYHHFGATTKKASMIKSICE